MRSSDTRSIGNQLESLDGYFFWKMNLPAINNLFKIREVNEEIGNTVFEEKEHWSQSRGLFRS